MDLPSVTRTDSDLVRRRRGWVTADREASGASPSRGWTKPRSLRRASVVYVGIGLAIGQRRHPARCGRPRLQRPRRVGATSRGLRCAARDRRQRWRGRSDTHRAHVCIERLAREHQSASPAVVRERRHEVSHGDGVRRSSSGCRLSRPVPHREHRSASMPVNAISLSTHVDCGVSPLVGVSSSAGVAAAVVVGGGGGASSTRALSSVVVAWQGASSP